MAGCGVPFSMAYRLIDVSALGRKRIEAGGTRHISSIYRTKQSIPGMVGYDFGTK